MFNTDEKCQPLRNLLRHFSNISLMTDVAMMFEADFVRKFSDVDYIVADLKVGQVKMLQGLFS